MTSAYRHLVEAAVPTRQAAALLGLSRTTIYRQPAAPVDHEPVVPPSCVPRSGPRSWRH